MNDHGVCILGSAGADLKASENEDHTMRTATTLLLIRGDTQLGHNEGRKKESSCKQYSGLRFNILHERSNESKKRWLKN